MATIEHSRGDLAPESGKEVAVFLLDDMKGKAEDPTNDRTGGRAAENVVGVQ
ncbi:hypothetical protein GCM10027090_21840 [Sinomonas soli]